MTCGKCHFGNLAAKREILFEYATILLMAQFKAQGKHGGVHVSVELPVAFIDEGDSVVAYTPALDLSTCGKNKKEAEKMFQQYSAHLFQRPYRKWHGRRSIDWFELEKGYSTRDMASSRNFSGIHWR